MNRQQSKIREATMDDVPFVIDLSREYHAKSSYAGEPFSAEQLAYTCGYAVAADDRYFCVAEVAGRVVGYAAFQLVRLCTERPIAQLFIIYADPEFPGLGRPLIEHCIEKAKKLDAWRFHFGSQAGFNDNGRNDRMLVNLSRRLGFTLAGPTFMKEI